MLSDYQLKTTDLYNIPIDNVKKLVPKFYDKEKRIGDSLWKLETLLKIMIKAKKIYRVSEFNQFQWLKHYVEFRKAFLSSILNLKNTKHLKKS